MVPLEQLTFPVRFVSYLLPSTYGVEILHNIMGRAEQGDLSHYAALGLISLVGMVLTVWLFGRQLRAT